MKIMEKYYTQKGLTLVEVLAALVLMGIIFVGIMTVFPQMTLINGKTEAKLDTMNLARQEMTKITKNPYDLDEMEDLSSKLKEVLNKKEDGTNITLPNPYTINSDTSNSDYNKYMVSHLNSSLPYEIMVYKAPDLVGNISLYKVILQIKTTSSNPKSETFGYIEAIRGTSSP